MRTAGSATRMELLRLRRRLDLARRGHRLLKGKQDELLRRFLLLMEAYLLARQGLHRRMAELADLGRQVRIEAPEDTIRTVAWPPPGEAEILVRSESILNLQVPVYELRLPERKPMYGPTELPAAYDSLIAAWRTSAPLLIEVGQKERALVLLSSEIEKTRRRVNALEFNLIPGLEKRIRVISFKLAENELASLTRLMRVKEIVQGREDAGI